MRLMQDQATSMYHECMTICVFIIMCIRQMFDTTHVLCLLLCLGLLFI